MSELNYTIDYDFLTKEYRIKWSHYLKYERWLPSVKGWKIHLDFNIQNNKPYLHFRYYGIKLRVNDRVFIGSSTSCIELKVVTKPHRFDNEFHEVDFLLVDTDIDFLRNAISRDIYIVFDNGDSTFRTEGCIPILYKYTLTVDDILGRDRDNAAKCTLKYYFELYARALNDINDKVGKKHVPNNILSLPEELGVSASPIEGRCDIKSNPTSVTDFNYCYVYLMHDKRSGYYKIGISKDPKYREKTLQSEQPEIEMICNKRYPSRRIAEAIEFALHKAYTEQRVRGEWFKLSDIDIQMLKETLS